MSIIDENLLIQSLEYLGKIYSDHLSGLEWVVADHEDRKEIQKHVAYCFEMGFMEAHQKGHDKDDAPTYADIKLHEKSLAVINLSLGRER
jgi:hypothetical protein